MRNVVIFGVLWVAVIVMFLCAITILREIQCSSHRTAFLL